MSELAVPATGLVAPNGQPISGKALWGFDEEKDLIEEVFKNLGPIENIVELFHNDVFVVKYFREKVSEHLLAAKDTRNIDRYEGVIGLVYGCGPAAFLDDDRNKFHGKKVEPGDWVLYRNSDGWDKNVQILGSPQYYECRMLQDSYIRGRVRFPARML